MYTSSIFFDVRTVLRLSPAKTEIYAFCVSDELLSEVVLRSGFKVGSLPVKCLPLIPGKLSEKDFKPVID